MSDLPTKFVEIIELLVPFHDLDPVNIVWHGNYVKYLAHARDALMTRLGFSYPQMQECGFVFPVIDVRLRYLRPARLGQRLRIAAELIETDPRLVVRYLITDAQSGERILRGHTTQVPVDAHTGAMSYRAPDALLDRVGRVRR